ncbi:MAG: D-alanyl-D-alanine dipeptidase [Mycobacterium sp.]|nr:D-alanyl-D-alanine dipeptidase [Mycobacterium sp.]
MRYVLAAVALAGALAWTAPMSRVDAAPDRPVPPVSPQAQAAGLVDVRTVVPDAIVDLRYATANNFVGVALYPADARCLVHESLGPGLAAAAAALRQQGYTLVFWDCYRPHEVQVRMFQAVPDPAWVARPTGYARSHESARSVDVTLAVDGRLVDMGTDFDDFSPRATAYATEGVSAAAQANRAVLRTAMAAGGLAGYPGEWWHFDGPGAGEPRPILDVPVN